MIICTPCWCTGDEPSLTVYVGNMSYDTDERTLRETFPGCVNVKIPTDRENGKPRGYVCTVCSVVCATDAQIQAIPILIQ